MPESEITLAELLKTAGYTTGCIGKWDVSNRKDIKGRVPNDQGFDYYWRTLGANDNGTVRLYDNRRPIGIDRDMAGLTKRYTDKGIEFLKANKNKPFLLYLAHTMAHSVIDATAKFKGKSKGGLYGVDQTALLFGDSQTGARYHFYYFCRQTLHGVRKGRWKLLLANHKNYYNYVKDTGSNEMELYDLKSDIGEKRNQAKRYPEVVKELLNLVRVFQWPAEVPETNR